MSNLDDAIPEPSPKFDDLPSRPHPDMKVITVDGKIVGCILDGKRKIFLHKEKN